MTKNTDPEGQTKEGANGSNGSDTPGSVDPGEFDPDRALSPGYKKDRLGFRPIAKKLASSLATQPTSHGLVVSIEGKWGSGKSSLVYMLSDELKKIQEQAPEIVQFEPWLGEAIGWLMSELIRGQVFAHGRYGDEARPEEDWFFSEEELDEAIKLLLDRFKSTDRERIIDTPEVLTLMYGWLQAGEEDEVREWVQEQQNTDAGFLKLLSKCRGWMSSDKVYYPLRRRDLKRFMDFGEALKRLKNISENTNKTENERALAEELLQAAEIGKDD